MKVLIGCEESGVGRRAFRARGHEAWSNDLENSRDNSFWHYKCDVMQAIDMQDWDLIILHPECTALTVAGNGTYADTQEREDAINWTEMLWLKAIKKAKVGVCLENPVSVFFSHMRHKYKIKANYVQPWQHGHPEQKKTGLLLDRLPPLKETNNVYAHMMTLPKHERERIFYMSPGANRSRDRSKSYSGILAAMADQWGIL